MALLEFRQVGLAYPNSGPVLENISLDIQEGEFITILGPSGCGKSTLLKLAAGIILPTEGSILFQGDVIRGVHYKRGIMFQEPHLFPWLSVEKNIGFGLKMRGTTPNEIREKVNEYIDFMGLREFSAAPPYELSGGMKQRTALARTLVNDPDMIMMDEPFAALDAFTKEKMQNLVRNLWSKTGKTFIFVTHDIDEALTLGTQVIVMSPRPGMILKKLEISFLHDESDPQTNPMYKDIKRSIYQLIAGET